MQTKGHKHNVANSYFSQLCECAWKWTWKKHKQNADEKKESFYTALRHEEQTIKSKTKTSSKIWEYEKTLQE
jgi:hypothetical protein